jgi:hypothetical protein
LSTRGKIIRINTIVLWVLILNLNQTTANFAATGNRNHIFNDIRSLGDDGRIRANVAMRSDANGADFCLYHRASVNDDLVSYAHTFIPITAAAVQNDIIINHNPIAENNAIRVSNDNVPSKDHAASNRSEQPRIKKFPEN